MTNTASEQSFIVDDDLFELGIDGYAQSEGGSSNVWRLKADQPRKGYFLNNPGTPGDWVKYREVAAFEGLRGGVEVPNGLKEFPVFDQVMVTDQKTGKPRRTTRPDNDKIMPLVNPGKYGRNGWAVAKDMMAFNFIEILTDDDTGEVTHRHIVLKLSGTASRGVLTVYRTQVEMNDGEFDMTAFPWTLSLTGSGTATTCVPKPHRKEGPIDFDEFEQIDIVEMLKETRAAVETFVDQIRTGGEAVIANQIAQEVDGLSSEGDEDDDDEELTKADQYASMTDAKLKKMLKDAGAEVPPKVNRPTLISLAVKHLD